MSQENVQLVLGLYQAPDVDYLQLYRDDSLWTEQADALAPFVHAEFDCVMCEFSQDLILGEEQSPTPTPTPASEGCCASRAGGQPL